MAFTAKKVPTAKKVARPTNQAAHEDPDPLGFAQVRAEISAELTEKYQTKLGALLHKFVLVQFEPAELQRIVEAGTAQEWPPVTLPATLTVYPPAASGFVRVLGSLATPFEAPPPAEPPDAAEDGAYIRGLFDDKIPINRHKPAQRSKGRRR